MQIETSLKAIPQVSVSQLLRHVDISMATGKPLYVHGASGIGKTALLNDYCLSSSNTLIKVEKEFIDLFLVALESVDFSGLPVVINDKATFAPSNLLPIEGDILPEDKLFVVLLDEIPLAQPSVQSACYKLLQEGRLGQNKLHKNVRFLLAGNRVEDRGHHNKVPPALNNRCLHVELSVDVGAWCEWAIQSKKIPLSMVAYIDNNPEQLHASLWENGKFQDAIKKPAWPSNRSWTNAGEAVKFIENSEIPVEDQRQLIKQSIAASVGAASAANYTAFHSVCKDLPTCKDIAQGRAVGGGKVALQQQYYVAISTIAYLDSTYDMKAKGGESQEALGNTYLYIKTSCDNEMVATFLTLMLQQRGFCVDPKNKHEGIISLWKDCLSNGTLKDFVHSDASTWGV